MGANYLADTNAGIDLLNGQLPSPAVAWLEKLLDKQQVALSVIVRLELLSWVGPPAAMQIVEDFIAGTHVLPLNEAVVQQTIQLRQHYRIKLPDAIIAATALVHNLPLITRNTADFQMLPGLQLVNPHDAAQLPVQL